MKSLCRCAHCISARRQARSRFSENDRRKICYGDAAALSGLPK
jgi:hypothetical protein